MKIAVPFVALALVVLSASPALAQSGERDVGDRMLTFRLDVEGEPPEGATFFGGFTPGANTSQLTDPDGDGVYTGQVNVDADRFPVSEPIGVEISGGTGTIEDINGEPVAPAEPAPGRQSVLIQSFGDMVVRDDQTFTASVSFENTDKRLIGTGDGDTLIGAAGQDLLSGKAGGDFLGGSGGADAVYGGPGDDTIYGGFGADALYGGPGDDRIYASGDGSADYVDCGPGDDLAYADPSDRVAGCEAVTYR